MSHRAVAFLSPGPTEERQRREILEFAEQYGHTITARTSDVQSAAQLIVDGHADIVIAAYDPRNGLRHLVTVAGGRLELARRSARQLPTLADWLRRALRRGVTPHHIGQAVGESTTDVSRIMRELGLLGHPDENQ